MTGRASLEHDGGGRPCSQNICTSSNIHIHFPPFFPHRFFSTDASHTFHPPLPAVPHCLLWWLCNIHIHLWSIMLISNMFYTVRHPILIPLTIFLPMPTYTLALLMLVLSWYENHMQMMTLACPVYLCRWNVMLFTTVTMTLVTDHHMVPMGSSHRWIVECCPEERRLCVLHASVSYMQAVIIP